MSNELQLTPQIAQVFALRYVQVGVQMLEVCRALMLEWDGAGALPAMEAMDYDFPAVVEFFDWFNEHETDNETNHVAIELYLALGRYMERRGLWQKRRSWGWRVFEIGDDDLVNADVRVLNSIAASFQQLGHAEKSAELYKLALETAIEQDQSVWMLAHLYNNYASALWHCEKLDEASQNVQIALTLAQTTDDPELVVGVLMTQANIFYAQEHYTDSLAILRRIHAYATASGDLPRLAECAIQMAICYTEADQLDAAGPYYHQAIELYTQLGDEIGLADAQLTYVMWASSREEDIDTDGYIRASAEAMSRHDPAVFASVIAWLSDFEAEHRREDAEGDPGD